MCRGAVHPAPGALARGACRALLRLPRPLDYAGRGTMVLGANYTMTYLPLFLLLSTLNLGKAAQASQLQVQPVQLPMLSVSIAVPEASGRHFISLSTADPHFDVVVRNVSHQPLDFFAETCSAGYDTLHLELLSIDDKPLSPPIIVQRSVGSWGANVIYKITLEPGDVMVRELHFTKDNSFFGIPYQNFPQMQAGEVHKIRMRAVLEVGANKPPLRFWTGKIASDIEDYTVTQYSP